MKKLILIFFAAIVLTQSTYAQSSSAPGIAGFRRGLATVMLAGFGGAILGLSTLSFYGDPQEHIGNIWTGLALGALGGTAYVLAQGQRSSSMALDPFPTSAQQKLAQQKPALLQYAWEF